MRIMIDTNILIMGSVLSSKYILKLLEYIGKFHRTVLSDYIIDEFKSTAKNKFPDKYYLAERFLQNFTFETVSTPEKIDTEKFPAIRDIKDLPILVSAITENIDILITNDLDFKSVDIERPEILDPKSFLEKYCNFT